MRAWRERLLFLLLISPNMLLLAAFTFWPMIYNAYLSTISWNFLSPIRRFVGLRNYETVLSSEIFRIVLINTAVFTVVSVAATMVLGLGLALLLNQPLRWRNGARAVLFTPTVLSGAAIAIVWIYIFDPRFGLLAQILGWFGIVSPELARRPELGDACAADCLYLEECRICCGYLSGRIADDRSNALRGARIDGAGPWGQFWHITLPGLSPISFFLLVTSILACFQAFDIIQVMTEGGPVNATNMLVYHLYERGFIQSQAGPAGVVAMVMFVIMLILTILQLRFIERRVHYS